MFLKLSSLFGLAGAGVPLLSAGKARAEDEIPWAPLPNGEGFALDILAKSSDAALLQDWFAANGLALNDAQTLLFHVPPSDELPAGIAMEDLPSLYAESANAALLKASSGLFTSAQLMALGSAGNKAFSGDFAALMSVGGAQNVVAAGCCSSCCCCCCCCCCCSSSSGSEAAFKGAYFGTFGFDEGAPAAQIGVKGGMNVNDDGSALGYIIYYENDDNAKLLKIVVGTVGENGEVEPHAFTPDELQKLGPEALAAEIWG